MRMKGQISINVNDIIGKRLGKLKVISYMGYRYDIAGRLRHCYMVECDCGQTKIMRRNAVKYNLVKSCGCERGGYHGYKNEE